MAFIKDLYRDEIRDGYLVMSDMKKVWNRQLEIWAEVDRICRKHSIQYWAGWGTLLGAARHGGFIPWDEDMDLMLMRPEYDRFCAVLDDELNGEVFEIKHKTFDATCVAHSMTTVIESNYGLQMEYCDRINDTPQAMAIDIHPLDIAPDGTENSLLAFEAMQEVMTAVADISQIYTMTHFKKDGRLAVDIETLREIAALPFQERLAELYRYTHALWSQSSEVGYYPKMLRIFLGEPLTERPYRKEWFDETIYLPFETVEMPVPKEYEKWLTRRYGDWRTPVDDGGQRLGLLHSADIPWREFFRLVDVQKILDDWNRKHNPQLFD
ncbi:MAG: LicD family protein [Selenomonadaceae bacterium]|nr:LicD family protein [Selenomonadaceae bacterium]